MSDARLPGAPSGPGSGPPEHPPEQQEQVDLDPELRRAVLDLHGSLESLDYYALLGLELTADRKAVKHAYYEAAAKFHPDRHFRKKLGSFKARMEAIFARLTLAHDTLSDRVRRAEYDAYMQAKRQSRSIEDLLADAVAEVRRVQESVEQQARLSSAPAAAPGSPAAPAGPKAPAPQATGPSASQSPVVDAAARRDALARRLLGGSRLPAGSSAPPGARPLASQRPGPTPGEAMEALRRRYEERVLHAKAARAHDFVAKAKSAQASGDPVAAASALRIARSLVPDDAEVRRMADETQAQADVIVGRTYAQQAEYEEKNGHWPEAAKSWTRACRARGNDARLHERAANAILQAAGDLHEAARLGQRACAIEPSSAPARVTLARVYLAAGLALNARRELEAAAQLAPEDDTIREMIEQASTRA